MQLIRSLEKIDIDKKEDNKRRRDSAGKRKTSDPLSELSTNDR